MTPAEREIARQRAALMRIESNGMSEIARSYQVVLKDLNEHLDALMMRIEIARAQGIEVRPAWLAAEERYRALVAQQEANTLDYLRSCIQTVKTAKNGAAVQANGDAPRLTKAVLGPAPAHAEAVVANSFTKLPTAEMAQLVRNAADGKPLGNLLYEIAPESTQKVKDALNSGVARGASIKTIATDVRQASGIAQNRAMLICRTEVIDVYREVALENYRRSPVVDSWIWMAETNACPVCSAEHGSEHSLDESLDSHPGCRCCAMPKTKSWAELGFNGIPDSRPSIQPGPERFAALPEGDRLAILGRSRFDAYERGEITLQDMIRETKSARWGAGKRTASLQELGVG
jgi:SPP1 gp7 family putative phage head morphogenesis protein